MDNINYSGNIYQKLFDVFEKKDGLTLGEKLFSVFRQQNLRKHLLNASGKDIYEAIERYLSFPVDETDVQMSEEEFNSWLSNK